MASRLLARLPAAGTFLSATIGGAALLGAMAAPEHGRGDEPVAEGPAKLANDRYARLRFAPMWMPVPKFMPDATADTLAPSAAYAMIWQVPWQQELGLSPFQRKALDGIRNHATGQVKKQAEQFRNLSPEEQQQQIAAWGGKASPWRRELDVKVADQITSVLAPRSKRRSKTTSSRSTRFSGCTMRRRGGSWVSARNRSSRFAASCASGSRDCNCSSYCTPRKFGRC